MNSRAVATANSVRSMTPAKDASPWGDMVAQADMLVRSGFLPPSIKTAEQAIAIILTGNELGIPKMLALRSIHVIQGRPTLSADLMASLVQREIDKHGDGLLMVQPPTETACTVRFRRWGWKEQQEFTYSMEDAKRAGLLGKDTWKAHPGAMLRARATAAVCRMAFPDVIAGLYAPDELSELPMSDGAEERDSGDTFAFSANWTENENEAQAVDGDIIDADTGEIRPILDLPVMSAQTDDEINDRVKYLRERLGWSAQDVIAEAGERKINLRQREGMIEILGLLEQMVRTS